MFNRVCQQPIVIAAFVGAMVLVAGLPADQFIELAKLVIPSGFFVAVGLYVLIAPLVVVEVIKAIQPLRISGGWVLAQRTPDFAAVPAGSPSVLLPPPRSIS